MRYLFQGDSITDWGRGKYDDPHATGCGYPRILEAELTAADRDCEVLNCGISGSRVVDLLARELRKSPAEIVQDQAGSWLLDRQTKSGFLPPPEGGNTVQPKGGAKYV